MTCSIGIAVLAAISVFVALAAEFWQFWASKASSAFASSSPNTSPFSAPVVRPGVHATALAVSPRRRSTT
jgi:hypothetical protein